MISPAIPRKMKLSVTACVTWLLTLTAFNASTQISLVEDINRMNETCSYDFSYMQEHNGYIYLVFNNEIWKSDGTKENTSVVKSFDYISGSSFWPV